MREIRYVRIGMLVEWKKPVCFSDDVDSKGRVSTVNLLVSVESACHVLIPRRENHSPQPFKKVRKVSSLRRVAAMMN